MTPRYKWTANRLSTTRNKCHQMVQRTVTSDFIPLVEFWISHPLLNLWIRFKYHVSLKTRQKTHKQKLKFTKIKKMNRKILADFLFIFYLFSKLWRVGEWSIQTWLRVIILLSRIFMQLYVNYYPHRGMKKKRYMSNKSESGYWMK